MAMAWRSSGITQFCSFAFVQRRREGVQEGTTYVFLMDRQKTWGNGRLPIDVAGQILSEEAMLMRRSLRCVLFAVLLMVLASPVFAQVAISVSFGPPALPVYEQPICPEEGYIWTPGYWAWDPDYGYYWVPGTWVLAPQVGYLWTPPWWGWGGSAYIFHAGYWGPTIGFYGGINYGFGYFGHGFDGGRWQGDRFFYNRSVVNVNVVNIHNVYNETIVNRGVENRVSYNGGEGGLTARPTAQEEAAGRENHLAPIAAQTQHIDQARANPQLRASANQGKPPIAATDRPTAFTGKSVVAAREAGAPYHAPANAPGARPTYPTHAADLPQHAVTTPPSTGNADQDRKFQQQQEKLVQKQNQEHQKLAQQQQREDQRAQQRNFAPPQQQQMEQRHQQQTQQMEERHTSQMQGLQERQMGRPSGGGGGRPPR
jgi:hypothetical protein